MGELHPRHRYGTYALIFALLALAFAGFSKGAVWATVEDESTTIISANPTWDIVVNVTIESDLHLREMESEIASTMKFGFGIDPEEGELSEIETYDELAQSSEGDVSSTFEDLDTAGAVAEWMIWIGIGAVIITAILCFCSLAQIAPSRPTLLAGGISSALLFFTPIVWFLLLPSDGTYANDSILAPIVHLFDEEPELLINFEPTPSTGVFLSILGGLCAAAMMAMIVLYNRSELTEEKPSWMISDDYIILQNVFNNPRISGLPWATIGVVMLVLFALGGGGYITYAIFSSDDIDDVIGTYTVNETISFHEIGSGTEFIEDGETVNVGAHSDVGEVDDLNIVGYRISSSQRETEADCAPLAESGVPDNVTVSGGINDNTTFFTYEKIGGETEVYSFLPDLIGKKDGLIKLLKDRFENISSTDLDEMLDGGDAGFGEYSFDISVTVKRGGQGVPPLACENSDDDGEVDWMIELISLEYTIEPVP